ncbi:MAG: PPE family protein [Mycobacterium sp.]
MDFGALPPEITSVLIHTGPGAGSLIQASAMWQQLGIELEASVGRYTSVLSLLAADWRGPSSIAMAKAVDPYLAWLGATAQQCERVGASVRAVAGAFELTHFTVVPPALVAANRTRLAALLATNFFGINLPAIAETEAEYTAMWVNNSAAMYRYAATSASAAVPPQFSPPPAIADPAGLVTSAASAGPANPAGVLSDLQALSLATFDPNAGWFGYFSTWGWQFLASGFPISLLAVDAQYATANAIGGLGGEVGLGLTQGGTSLAYAEAQLAGALGAIGSGEAPTAALGVAVTIGRLSAPASVVGLLPAAESPVRLAAAVSALPAEMPPWLGVPMTPMVAPGSATGKRGREGRDYDDIEYGAELLGTFMQRPPSAG